MQGLASCGGGTGGVEERPLREVPAVRAGVSQCLGTAWL